ncbi:MAG TPA: TonB-dependent receptor [Dinghuibacter sp.]|uniref:TonB-dependent receptor n=1 Tax=Dinghuibacter sp. TaxID=2024697 RepID=UPI002B6CA106|nr:TonB-dependent receptor [Dinghuibacter sp.]HTJ12013.1 TonB-dependent receptor [Dinghuibacter sp.]
MALLISARATAQQPDSAKQLKDVIINGFAGGQRLSTTPSAVGYITQEDLQRTAGASLLPAVNTIPGVRMEERSPQSFRLSIRGSLLRSPFGVRNVKVYWDDMPLTDAGGNTYVNVLDMNTFQSIEVLKGPGGSMYGANTGGVVLFQSDTSTGSRVQLRGGSYNQWGEDAMWQARTHNAFNALFQSHNQSDGYRDHSASHRDTYQDWGHIRVNKNDQLDWFALYTDLFYQTPGGLTIQQLFQNPRAARPSTPTIPGAAAARAAIYAQTWFTGVTNRYTANNWTNTTTVLVSGTHFDNPFLTDYEQRKELTLEALTRWIYDKKDWRVVLGAEYQYTRSKIHDWGNTDGSPDTTQTNDNLQAYQLLPYAQAEWRRNNWLLLAGTSINTFTYHYIPIYPANAEQTINLHAQVLPRLSLQYQLIPGNLSIYATASRGYSPPTIAEIFPGTSLFYNNLQPEEGWNYELGIKSYLCDNRLQTTIALYDFRLRHTITPRYDSAGHAYYVNAGNTNQEGLEAQITWFGKTVRLFASYALQDYHFTSYTEGTTSYSGHPLTGVPRNVLVIGGDLTIKGFTLNVTNTYTDKLPVDDASDAWAGSYDELQAKLSWTHKHLTVHIGIDNALNQLYSLGNDLNAAGGRYFNTAPGRNVFAGCSLRIP